MLRAAGWVRMARLIRRRVAFRIAEVSVGLVAREGDYLPEVHLRRSRRPVVMALR